MNKEQKWDHGTDRTGRYRGGKTFADKRSGAHAARFANRQRPIRRQCEDRLRIELAGGPAILGRLSRGTI